MPRPGILFVKHFSTNAGFILNDIDLLNEKYDVVVYTSGIKKNLSIIFSLLHQFFYIIFHLRKIKLFYIWFGDYHSFIPILLGKIFAKKSVIAIGGYDATNIPEIDCGAFNNKGLKKKIRSFMLRFSLKNADKLLVVDDSLIENINNYIYSDISGKKPLKDGILNFIPELKDKIIVVYTGFDENVFRRNESVQKENFVLSVGYSPNENEFRRKGFDMLIEAAKIMKDTEFVLIGLNEDQIKKLSDSDLPNVKLISFVNMDELRGFYNRAKVFAQLSLFEGQPNSLCEAMMYECIPVGSDVNGIPRVIGDTGYIVYKKDLSEIVTKLAEALKSPVTLGKSGRKRITENFSLNKRKEKIWEIVGELLNRD
ncbi:MAG: glycosyltransferase family 4 protein [Ignavibacteria bacterium]